MAAAGGSCQSSVAEFPPDAPLRIIGLTDSAAGWLIFVAIVLIIYEIVVIIQRFLNVKIINQHILIVIIIVSAFLARKYSAVEPLIRDLLLINE